MRKRLFLAVAVSIIFFSSAGIVTFLSAQESAEGNSSPARESVKAQALETLFAPDRVFRTGSSTVYRVSAEAGVLVSFDQGKTWTERNQGLPRRVVYPFATTRPPIITDLSADPADANRIGITTLDTLFLSNDAGSTWRKIELKDPLKENDQLTCLSLSPLNPDAIAIGTSFHGFFESTDGGKSWISLSEPLVPLQLGGGNYEEISSLAYHPTDPDIIYFSLGFGKGLFSLRRGRKTVDRIDIPGDRTDTPIRDLAFWRKEGRGPWTFEVRTDDARWAYSPDSGWSMVEQIRSEIAISEDKALRMARAAGRNGIYVSSRWASGKLLDTHLSFLRANGLNSMVVDFKDDYGTVTYNTALAAPRRIGAVQQRFKIEDIVQTAHANGLYLIGRIVVFRDKQLYNADNYKYAVWDRTSKEPWRYVKKTVDETTGEESLSQGEYWVDPFSEYVWDYNIAIARELQDKGVDEIQFDYIRFPSDGDLSRIGFRFMKEGMGKLEALESFFVKARQSVSLPISTDVYGYCGWARISNWVAQNIEMFSRYVDVISPMFYPSHFPQDFLGGMEYLPRARYIYQEGTRRAAWIVEGRSVIRPYVQAFRLGDERNFTPAVYGTYLANQIQGSLQGAASGFTLWNSSNDYYMVTFPLGEMLAAREGLPPAQGLVPREGGVK